MNFNPIRYLKEFFGNYFNFIAGAASVIGLGVVFVRSSTALIIALVSFILFLIALFFRFVWVTEQFLKNKSENGYDKLATIVKYRTEDRRLISYDIQKYIQCKQVLMDEHVHQYHWTGTSHPVIQSDTMNFVCIKDGDDGYKKAVLKFKTPLIYNSFFIVHINMKIDDSDGKSKPYISIRVTEKTQLLTFSVELFYKTGRRIPDARISRKKLSDVPADFEFITNVPFNKKTLSYNWEVYDPEVGYAYKIDWIK